MTTAYSYDLRARIIDSVKSGTKIATASRMFKVSRDTIYKCKAPRKNRRR